MPKSISSFFIILIFFACACNSSVEKPFERPQPIKTAPIKNVEFKVPEIIKPEKTDSIIEDTLKHYHQETKETNKTIETKYIKRSFNLHKKPSVA